MKNIMKKVVIIAILAMMVMMMCGFTYETEEVPVSLIDELISEGFTRDEYNTNIWRFEEYDYTCVSGRYGYIFGWFDTDENIGMVTGFGYEEDGTIGLVTTGTVRWDNINEEFETICEYEYDQD